MNALYRLVSTVVITGFMFLRGSTLAIAQVNQDGVYNAGADDVVTLRFIETIFGNILQAALSLIGLVAFIMLVIGSFQYLISGGDPQKADQAKGTISMAIFGLAAAIGVWFVLVILENITGAGLLNFTFWFQEP